MLVGTNAQPVIAQLRVVPETREQIDLSFAPLVKRASPAVVNIITRRVVAVKPAVPPLFDDPFFRRFFGEPTPREPREREQGAVGSGVIVSPDGVIVTNHHVIEGADEIRVVLADRREFAARLIRDDERTDLAVLRVDNGDTPLPWLELANSDELEVGDLVLAIGNPFGVGQTVTSGIISGLARTNVGITDFNFFIQTDAAINPGNSGGALVTMDGRLAGVNTAIFSRSGGNQGIGFAVPANMVRTVIASVDGGLRVIRPWLGAALQNVDRSISEALGLERPFGVLITDMHPNGPAKRAGLVTGAVIVSVNGQPVAD
ncbi:MAG: trypsin-like peptidase domain-containing protein, partial [Alphaproteobacteria bacterium]